MPRKLTRRTIVAAFAALAASAALAPAAPAQEISINSAINCNGTILPDGVGGITVYIAGKPVRIPKVEDLYVCVRAEIVSLDTSPVELYYGCGPTCFAVFSPVWPKSGDVTAEVCYTADGSRTCVGESFWVNWTGRSSCLVSSGRPAQHLPNECLVVIDEDTLLP